MGHLMCTQIFVSGVMRVGSAFAVALALLALCQIASAGNQMSVEREPLLRDSVRGSPSQESLCKVEQLKDEQKIGGEKAGELEDYVSLFMGYAQEYVERKGGNYDQVLNDSLREILDTMNIDLSEWSEKYPEYILEFPEGSHAAKQHLLEFLERIATCASQNEYMLNFLVDLKNNHADEVAEDYKMLKAEHLNDDEVALDQKVTDACVYAHVLDVLTRAGRNNPLDVLPYFKERFRDKIRELKKDDYWKDSIVRPILFEDRVFETMLDNNIVSVTEHMNLFEWVKKYGLDLGADAIIEYAKKRSFDGNNFGLGVPVNIMEACLEDYRLQNFDNGDAGLAMLETGPEQSIECEWVKAKKGEVHDGALWMYPMMPKLWADLYSTWNAAFVSHYANAPFFYGKLFNPQVLCYEETPQEYLHNRMIALWLHIYFELLNRVKLGSASPPNNWSSQSVTNAWEKVNLKSSEAYTRAVDACLPLCPVQPPPNRALEGMIYMTAEARVAFKNRWTEHDEAIDELKDKLIPTEIIQRSRSGSLEGAPPGVEPGPDEATSERLKERIKGMSSSEYFDSLSRSSSLDSLSDSSSNSEIGLDDDGDVEDAGGAKFYDAERGPDGLWEEMERRNAGLPSPGLRGQGNRED